MPASVKDCHYPWTWLMLTSDGNVKPCCFAPGQLGNLHETDLDGIWNGAVAIELRRYIKADRIHPVCAGASCKYVRGQAAQGSTEAPTSTTPPARPDPQTRTIVWRG